MLDIDWKCVWLKGCVCELNYILNKLEDFLRTTYYNCLKLYYSIMWINKYLTLQILYFKKCLLLCKTTFLTIQTLVVLLCFFLIHYVLCVAYILIYICKLYYIYHHIINRMKPLYQFREWKKTIYITTTWITILIVVMYNLL